MQQSFNISINKEDSGSQNTELLPANVADQTI